MPLSKESFPRRGFALIDYLQMGLETLGIVEHFFKKALQEVSFKTGFLFEPLNVALTWEGW